MAERSRSRFRSRDGGQPAPLRILQLATGFCWAHADVAAEAREPPGARAVSNMMGIRRLRWLLDCDAGRGRTGSTPPAAPRIARLRHASYSRAKPRPAQAKRWPAPPAARPRPLAHHKG